jgi:hypothetical protein
VSGSEVHRASCHRCYTQTDFEVNFAHNWSALEAKPGWLNVFPEIKLIISAHTINQFLTSKLYF